MGDIAIRAQNVSKRFSRHTEKRNSLKERAVRGKAPVAPEFWALRDASFEVERGTTFGIIGHNGSGKSTALKVLTGVYRPTSGLVEVHGRVSALLELGAGFHPELTGRENIRLNGAILGLSRKRIDDAMEEIIDFSGIGEFVESPVKVYSSGMFLRLGFAIAVKMDPEILVVDEIIAVGDEQFQRKCTDYLYKLRQDGCTIVVVSHAMSQIEDMCDNAVWLSHGQVQSLGPARETVQKYLDSVNSEEIANQVETANVVTGDLLRVLRIPAGFRMYALLLSWASQGATAPCDWGYTPMDTNEGSLAAAPTAFTSALAMASANVATWLAGFNEIKFEQDAFLLGTFGTVVTGAAGVVRATCFGVSEGVR